MTKIGIIGAGAYGEILGSILSDKGLLVSFYDPKLPDSDISRAIDGADYVLLAVPSAVANDVLPLLNHDTPLIVATKGIVSKKIFSGFNDIMLISGPGFAKDIAAKKKTILTATDHRVIDLFSTDYLSFDYTNDIQGVLLCGSLKNVYAIGAGFLNLNYGSPNWRRYISDIYVELKTILIYNSCDPRTADLSCGIGDLKLTCDTPSRNFQFGQDFAKSGSNIPHETVEGLSALKAIHNGGLALPEDAVILKSIIRRVLNGTK